MSSTSVLPEAILHTFRSACLLDVPYTQSFSVEGITYSMLDQVLSRFSLLGKNVSLKIWKNVLVPSFHCFDISESHKSTQVNFLENMDQLKTPHREKWEHILNWRHVFEKTFFFSNYCLFLMERTNICLQ